MYIQRNKRTISILVVFIVFIVSSLSSCSQLNQDTLGNNQDTSTEIQKRDIENTKNLYDFNLLYSYKNVPLTDSEKVKELVSQLQYAKELTIDRIELKTENKESLRIDYRMNLTSGQQYKVNHTKMMADAVVLFALLDNLNAVEYNLVQEDYGYGGVPITREQAKQVLGADIDSLGKSEGVFLSDMPDIIAQLRWDPGVMDIITYEHMMGAEAVSYVLSYLKYPQKMSAQAMQNAVQSLFVAKDSYQDMLHQAYPKLANYEDGYYSPWPEGTPSQEKQKKTEPGQEKTSPQAVYSEETYGYSGLNTPLKVYKISNPAPTKKILCVFAMHGFFPWGLT